MKVFIKDMLNLHSLGRVKIILNELQITYNVIDLAEIEIPDNTSRDDLNKLTSALSLQELPILDNKKMILIERIKAVVVKMIRYSDDLPSQNYSHFISAALNHNYTYLANLFSASEKITIEHFIIKHKIEKVKELLLNDKYNLTEISHKMHYSSVAHLSNQFKKVTGVTTTYFKNNPDTVL